MSEETKGAFVLKDSGARQEFNTGSVRDTQDGKPRFDLIPQGPMYRLAMVYARGASKYNPRNWEKGQPLGRYFGSCIRHLMAWSIGMRDEDHLAQAAWNIFAIIHTEMMIECESLPKELDDRPEWQKENSPYNKLLQSKYSK
jgi:hypothetical protein